MSTLHIDRVSRWFGNVVAVNDITMTIGPGVTGLLGPNGAGKSTLIHMMSGFLAPSSGSVTLETGGTASGAPAPVDGAGAGERTPPPGTPVWRHEESYRHIGLVPEREGMYDFLTGHEFVLANAELHQLSDPRAAAAEALATVEMEHAQDRRISTYSKGMRQRVKMASALVHQPSVLLLDEPFNGMDPRQRMQLMELLRRMGDEGRTVLFSSHILEEVEQLASHIEVIVAGRHAASGDFRKIRRLMTDRPHRYLVRSSDDRKLAGALIADASTAGIEVDQQEDALRIQAVDFTRFTALLPRVAREHGIRLYTVSPSDESLESVFSYLVAA
ncbi:ABC transporter ATP-binding protein [Streptomyces cacaoi]|uniref:ABC transporter ATP-binding protein n=1 Tax=Streptomyces cacaoi TaxID=1898 RepID=UPI0033239AE4